MKGKGFTLIELLCALSIAAIVGLIAVPGLTKFSEKQELVSATHQILHQVTTAREYAITQSTYTSICPSNDGLHCTNRWDHGLLVFVDHNGDGVKDQNENIIRTLDLGQEWHVRWAAFGRKPALTIGPQGYTLHQNGTYYLCSKGAPKIGRMVIVNKAGRARIAQDTDGDGLAEKWNGNNMEC